MKKFRTLKFVTRLLTPRDWRCHKRRILFENLFESLKEKKDERGNYVSGLISQDGSSYSLSCSELAGDIPYYPFEERFYIDIGSYFNMYFPQHLYRELKVKIIRKSSLYSFFMGRVIYDVTAYGTGSQMNRINLTYTVEIKFL